LTAVISSPKICNSGKEQCVKESTPR
jgi:hypothetical protein